MKASSSGSLPSFPPLSPSAKRGASGNANEVQVKFTAPFYTSGEEVRGTVVIQCRVPFVAQSILVKVFIFIFCLFYFFFCIFSLAYVDYTAQGIFVIMTRNNEK